MENPWSSPWTADDPEKEAVSEHAGPSLVFPPAAKFDVAGPSPWADDDAFGDWADGGGRGASGDVGGSNGGDAEDTGGGGFLASAGLGAADVEPLPSLSADADPWAVEVTPIGVEAPGKFTPSEEGALEAEVLGGAGFADRPDDTSAAPFAAPEPLVSPTPARDAIAEERGSVSPEPTSPGAGPLGVSADAVAPVVLSHEDVQPGPDGTRQVPKVQELVDMYDGIAKKVLERPEQTPSTKPPHTGSPSPDEPGESAEDWEEFELGDQKPSDDSSPSTPPPALSTPAPNLPDPAAFKIDESAIAILFDALAQPPAAPAEIPDRLDPLDAFTVTERRAWYRLSRQGSARLHDAGDPDNCARVAWHGSAVRGETFSVVRRWMQEGASLGGRSRGGVQGSAASFGWEQSSSSDPVDLSFLAKRRSTGGGHSRSESASVSVPKPAGAGASADGVGGANARPPSVPSPPKAPNVAPEPPRSKPAKPSPLVFSTQREESDSDEEWGEMVSSPQATGSFSAAPDSRADSAVSFGKSGSGSSLDSRPVGSWTLRKADGRGDKPKRDRVRVVSPTSSGHADIMAETLPTQPQAGAAKADVPMQAGEAEDVGGVIARLPDLSYMLR